MSSTHCAKFGEDCCLCRGNETLIETEEGTNYALYNMLNESKLFQDTYLHYLGCWLQVPQVDEEDEWGVIAKTHVYRIGTLAEPGGHLYVCLADQPVEIAPSIYIQNAVTVIRGKLERCLVFNVIEPAWHAGIEGTYIVLNKGI